MTVRATWNGAVLAESDRTILVEGNHYFPPDDVVTELLEPSVGSTHCPWKGDASYYHVAVGGRRNEDAAWYYPEPSDAAAAIKDYVAFWKGVEVSGTNGGTREIRPPGRWQPRPQMAGLAPGASVSHGSAFTQVVLRPVARTINPLMRRIAGRRYVSFVSIVYHLGRRSGREYATPTEGRVFGDRVVIPLAFGTGSDWCRNIRAAGRGRIRWRGKEYEINSPEVFTYGPVRRLVRDVFPAWERVTFRIMGFSEFLVLQAGKPN